MDFAPSVRSQQLLEEVDAFVEQRVLPREIDYRTALAADPWQVPPVVDELKAEARAAGLWNLFMPDAAYGAGLTNVEYAPLAERMGRAQPLGPEVFNCNAPDTGNAEVLVQYGSDEQREQWLVPLLSGRTRSAFCMTEPHVASSDAANIAATARLDGAEVVVDGRKWWSTGIGHPRCAFMIVLAVTDPGADRHHRHSMVLVPRDSAGVRVERLLDVFGYHDEPYGHGEVTFSGVRLPASAIIAGPGQGAEIAQGRLGPGRIHHCMRLIGQAELALELACGRALDRTAFGRPLARLGGNAERIAQARIAIDQARLLVLRTAWLLDTAGVAAARSEVSQIKAVVPRMAAEVIDMAIQLHGGAGVSGDLPLAAGYASARALRLADGPDEVHLALVASEELRRHGRRRR